MDTIRVVIADHEAPARARVRAAIELDRILVVGEATDVSEAVALARSERPDVVVVDVQMAPDGATACARILEVAPETAVVVLTDSTDGVGLFQALQAGAAGYLPKDMD